MTDLEQVDEHGVTVEWDEARWPAPPPVDQSTNGQEGDDATSWTRISLRAALTGTGIPDPVLLRREDNVRLLYPGRIHWFFGIPESLKSWLAMIAVKEALAAEGIVLFLDFEDDEDGIVERARALAIPEDVIDSPRFVYVRPEEALYDRRGDPTSALADFDRILTGKFTLGIVDGITEAMVTEGLDIIGNADAALFMRRVARRIARTGAGTVGIDHLAKNASGEWAIGGQHKKAGLTGAAYSFELQQAFGHGLTGKARITCEKDRPGRVRPHLGPKKLVGDLVLTSYPDGSVTHHIEEPSTSTEPSPDLLKKITDHLARYVGENKGNLRKLGNSDAVDDALNWMADHGELEIKQSGNAHKHYLIDPDEEAET
jgi:hypothetical protein